MWVCLSSTPTRCSHKNQMSKQLIGCLFHNEPQCEAINPYNCWLPASRKARTGDMCRRVINIMLCTMHPLPLHTNSFTNTKYRHFSISVSYPTFLVRAASLCLPTISLLSTEHKSPGSAATWIKTEIFLRAV